MELEEDDLSTVLDDLLEAQTQSYYLGLALGLSGHVLKAIHASTANQQDRLCRVIETFLKGVNPRPTWSAIAIALKKPSVGLPRLAENIEQKYCHPSRQRHEYGNCLWVIGENCLFNKGSCSFNKDLYCVTLI